MYKVFRQNDENKGEKNHRDNMFIAVIGSIKEAECGKKER